MADRRRGWTKKVCNQPDSKVTYYTRHIVIFLDAVRPGFGERQGASLDDLKHEQKYNLMGDMYVRYVDHDQIIEIIMNPGEQQATFIRRLKNHLNQYDRHDHITIIYHGGRTGMFETDYKWTFRGDGPRTVDGYEVIKIISNAESDCLVILECWIPDRLRAMWEQKFRTIEIMYAGNNGRDCNFFESIHRRVKQYALSPKGEAKFTIPQLMGKDYFTSSNTRRVWLKKTKNGSEDLVKRFAIKPDQVKITNKLELVAVEIQGPSNDNLANPGDENGSDGQDGDNGGGDQGGDDDGNDGDGDSEDSEDGNSNEDGDARGDHGPGGGDGGDDDRRHMGDETANDGSDDGNDMDNTDALRKQLRKQLCTTTEEVIRNSPEIRKIMLALSKSLEPAPQPVERPSKRQRLFGRQLPTSGLGGGEVVGPSERDDGESLFLPRNGAKRPATKRAKTLAATGNEGASHNTNVMDLGDEDETANDANNDSLIERLVGQNDNNVSRQHFRATSHVCSPIPKKEEKDDFKRSNSPISPYFDFGDNLTFNESTPVKRERSRSPGLELVGSRSLAMHIDLTTDDVVFDLTQEDESEES